MALIAFNWTPTNTQLKWFGCLWLPLTLIVISIALFLKAVTTWILIILALLALLSIVLGMVVPHFLRGIFVGLLLITFPIGFLISHVLLAIFFFCVVTPTGWIMRLMGQAPMRLRFDREAPSYWIRRETGPAPVERYFRQF